MLTDGYHDVPLGKLAMVVTHLEMREAAPSRDVPAPEGVTLRALTRHWTGTVISFAGSDRTGSGSDGSQKPTPNCRRCCRMRTRSFSR